MALSDLSIAELQGVVEQLFVEQGLQEYYDISEIATYQVQAALNRDFALIQDFDRQMGAYLGERLATAIATKQSPIDLRKELIKDGKIQALTITDKNGVQRTISADTRAATIARTELFKSYEETKAETAAEIMDEPIGIAKTAGDSKVRDNHQEWNGWAMPLSAWDAADDRPGKMPNCRCTLRITERRRFNGEINDSLPF